MIKFENITKVYPKKVVSLDHVSLTILDGEFVCLVGQSGAGKSTLLKMLTAEENPTEGRVFLGDTEVSNLSSGELPYLRRRIGVVFQDYKLLPKKTVAENIAFALEISGEKGNIIKEKVSQVLRLVGLTSKANSFPQEMSGGEKQRVVIARALIHEPELIIADEPTGNLDRINAQEIIQLLLKINSLGNTIILATHDKEIVDHIEKRVISLKNGKVASDKMGGKYVI
ncbi:cell division ATP-binding protein FtsE [bacterium]|nr:MAG: cell division ATP-binding protein FtsE [bacterium]